MEVMADISAQAAIQSILKMFTPPAAEPGYRFKINVRKIASVAQWKLNGVTSTICKILLETGPCV